MRWVMTNNLLKGKRSHTICTQREVTYYNVLKRGRDHSQYVERGKSELILGIQMCESMDYLIQIRFVTSGKW